MHDQVQVGLSKTKLKPNHKRRLTTIKRRDVPLLHIYIFVLLIVRRFFSSSQSVSVGLSVCLCFNVAVSAISTD